MAHPRMLPAYAHTCGRGQKWRDVEVGRGGGGWRSGWVGGSGAARCQMQERDVAEQRWRHSIEGREAGFCTRCTRPGRDRAAAAPTQFLSMPLILALPSSTAEKQRAVLPVNSSEPHTRICAGGCGERGVSRSRAANVTAPAAAHKGGRGGAWRSLPHSCISSCTAGAPSPSGHLQQREGEPDGAGDVLCQARVLGGDAHAVGAHCRAGTSRGRGKTRGQRLGACVRCSYEAAVSAAGARQQH